MYDPARHAPLTTTVWDEAAARAAIQDIARDAATAFSPATYWPTHPMDGPMPDGVTNLYFGAAGVLWGLDFLHRAGVADHDLAIGAVLPALLAANHREFGFIGGNGPLAHHGGSLLFGDSPILLLLMRQGDATAADALRERVEQGLGHPILELMWGAAGLMLACVFAFQVTGEDRWRQLYLAHAARLLAELDEAAGDTPVWTQDLYGSVRQYLGPVHGYAGNMAALLRGWAWLAPGDQARLRAVIAPTLEAHIWRSPLGANWPPVAPRNEEPTLVQHCHGAAGMVTTFADPAIDQPTLKAVLVDAGRLIWVAGPLAKGSNLCHGTGGNGMAFLRLHALTGEARWLERARAFAMTAIDQCRAARLQYGRGRYSLWTGDIGLALYLHECLTPTARFPTVDVFWPERPLTLA